MIKKFIFSLLLCGLAFSTTLRAADLQALPIDPISNLAWSPNSNQIAVGRGTFLCDEGLNRHIIQIVDSVSRKIIQNLVGAKCSITALDWSPDGTKLAASSLDDIGIRVWDVETGQLLMEVGQEDEGTSSIKWRPTDGLQLAYAAFYKNKIGVLDFSTGEKISQTHIEGSTLDWSPDGSKLVSGSRDDNAIVTSSPEDNKVYVTDMTTGKELLALGGHTADVRNVDWSPDGTKLASAGNDWTLRLWDAVSGKPLITIDIPNISETHWSPDSQKLATSTFDGKAQIWDASSGLLLKTFVYLSGIRTVAWSPDGTQIAYAGDAIDEKEPEVQFVDVQ